MGANPCQRVVEVGCQLVEVAGLEPPLDAMRVDLDVEARRPGQRRRERLGAAHPSETRGQHRVAGEVGGAPVLLGGGHKRLEGALKDALAADVNPRSGRHLPVHREALGLEQAKLVPGGKSGHQHRVGQQHPWGAGMGTEDSDRLAGLDEQRLVPLELDQGSHDRAQRLGVSGGAARTAVDDQPGGILGDLGVEVIQEHAQRRLLMPALTAKLRASRGANRAQIRDQLLHLCCHRRRCHNREGTTARPVARLGGC